jgi:hypothetical protein
VEDARRSTPLPLPPQSVTPPPQSVTPPPQSVAPSLPLLARLSIPMLSLSLLEAL